MGNLYSLVAESWPAAPKWTAADVPDLSGKVFIVTGGNSGIGKETARHLLAHNAKVYIGCRSPERAKAAADDLKSKTGKTDADLVVLKMDLSDLGSVKAAVEEFLSKETRLDVLINNAGIMWSPPSLLTTHGHDAQFGTNVLGHFYLTTLLLPILISSSKTSVDGSGKSRVVNVSSLGHRFAPGRAKGGPVVIESLVPGKKREGMSPQDLYHQSKAGNVLFANALARKYGDQGIVSTSLNPGNIESGLQQNMTPFVHRIVSMMNAQVDLGCLTSLYAATAPETGDANGEYFGPWARPRPVHPDMAIVEKQEEMWAWCEAQVKLYAPA